MAAEKDFLARIDGLLAGGGADAFERVLLATMKELGTESGTVHLLGADGLLHLRASGPGMPDVVLQTIRRIPVGKGMAGLAVERGEPVTACNIQTDATGDVRPGAKATGLQGAIVVPCVHDEDAVGALGVANVRERTFTPEEIDVLLAVGRAIARHAQTSGAGS